jgi:FHA domain-containing protein
MLGRGRDADLTVAHATVSRHHCLIYELEGALVVRDNGSLNGTVVDGQRVQEALIKPGQSLTIGPLTFRAEYEHHGDFPVLGSGSEAAATAEANGQSNGELDHHDVLKIDTSKGKPARRAAPPPEEPTAEESAVEATPPEVTEATSAAAAEHEDAEYSSSDKFDFLDDDAANEDSSSAPSFGFLKGSEQDAADSAIGGVPAVSSDSDDDLALPVDLPVDEPSEDAADRFGFLHEEPAEDAAPPDTHSDDPDLGEEVFRLADEPSQVVDRDIKPTGSRKEAAAKTEKAKPADVAPEEHPIGEPSAKLEDGNDDAALDDFLNSLGLEE